MGKEVKNPLRAQSKYGLMGTSAKSANFCYWGVTRALFWVKNIKGPFEIGHPPTYTSNLVYMCAGEFRGPKSSNRIELS